MSSNNDKVTLSAEELQDFQQKKAEVAGAGISLRWMQRHPWEYQPCAANSKLLTDYISQHELEWNEDNLETAYQAVKHLMAPSTQQPPAKPEASVVNDDALASTPKPSRFPTDVPFETRADVHHMSTDLYKRWFHDLKEGALFRARVDAIQRRGV